MPRRPAIAFLAALFAVAVILALTVVSGNRDNEAAAAVADTLELLHRLFAVSAGIEEASALDLQRRLLGTDVNGQVAAAADRARTELSALAPLAQDPAQLEQLAKLRALVDPELTELVAASHDRTRDALGRDMRRMERIRGTIGALLDDARLRLVKFEGEAENAGDVAEAVVIAGALVVLGAIAFAANTARREFEWRTEMERLEERLVGMITHDLRSPLAAILAEARFLERKQAPVGPLAARIASAAIRIDRLTTVIAAFVGSHLDGGLLLQRAPSDLRDIIERTVAELAPDSARAMVQVETRGDLRGTWDRTLLSQLVANLLDNALRHGENHAPVRVRAAATREAVVLEVENDGEIAPELQSHLFEALRQNEQDATVRFSGGLGLFVVQAIARAHGGSVSASSSPERGTLFTVILPRRPEGGSRRSSRTLRTRSMDRPPPRLPDAGRVMVW